MAKAINDHRLGAAIRKVRKAQDRRLADLAGDIGSDASNLSRMERGVQEIPQRIFVAICRELRVSPSELWRVAEGADNDSGDSGELLGLTSMMTPEQKERLLDYGKYLVDR